MRFISLLTDSPTPYRWKFCIGFAPSGTLDSSRGTKASPPAENLQRAHKLFFAAYDRYLDRICKVDWLARPQIGAMIRDNLYYHHGSKYHLLAYCIMPNHVHLLLQPVVAGGSPAVPTAPGGSPAVHATAGEPPAATSYEDNTAGDEASDGLSPLASIMHSLKSYTAHQANRLLLRSGKFWLAESYDHWVRDDDELERIVDYIAANPVKARLVEKPQDWPFCSAHDRFLQDGESCGWLLLPAGRPVTAGGSPAVGFSAGEGFAGPQASRLRPRTTWE